MSLATGDLRGKLKRKTLLDDDDARATPLTKWRLDDGSAATTRSDRDSIKSALATPQLLTELRQWRFARSLVDVFTHYGDGPMYYSGEKNAAEARNMLDRWLLSFQLDYAKSMDKRYPLFPQSLCPDDPVNQKLMDECLEKKFSLDKRNARQIFNELDRLLREFQADDSDLDAEKKGLQVMVIEDKEKEMAHVVLDDFKSKDCWRVSFLVRNFGLLPAGRMLMRYEALGTGSLQWGDPITVHNALHDRMGVRYEGFASPLNSKMIDKEDARFCSLFPDTDTVFGSMGSFFGVDFNTCNGGWTVNPPFIEELMDRVALKILGYLDTGKTDNWFFVTFPRWVDTPGWERLSGSEHLRDKIELDDGRFTVQDSYGRIFPPRNNLTIFVLGCVPQLPRLADIKEAFRNTDMECVKAEWQMTCRKRLKAARRVTKPAADAADAPTAAAVTVADRADSAESAAPLPVPPIVVAPPPTVRNRQLRRFQKPSAVTAAAPEAAAGAGAGTDPLPANGDNVS